MVTTLTDEELLWMYLASGSTPHLVSHRCMSWLAERQSRLKGVMVFISMSM